LRDARALKELELHAVARLYGLEEAPRPSAAVVGNAAVVEAYAPRAPIPDAFAPRPLDLEAVAAMDWQLLRETARACAACGLCRQRKQAVFGVGHASAPWLFIGEGPGADEDEQGDPFVGQAGKLLDGMLAAVGIARGREVYIANVVKCRPPGNRTPTPQEALACAPLLDRQIELVRPKLIVALGRTAATRLLGTDASLASLRGRLHSYKGTALVVTYHPAYLLRNLPDKAKAWEDLLFARRALRMETTNA
jgi:DNA polymerase